MYNWVYYSSDFQCPWTGVPVQLLWDPTENGVIMAKIDEFQRCEDNEFYDKEITRETEKWCEHFGVLFADDLEEANEIAEEYDCYFY